jgi:hypothetical protein
MRKFGTLRYKVTHSVQALKHSLRRRFAADGLLLVALLGAALGLSQWAYSATRAAHFAVDTVPVLLPLEGFHEVERFPDASGAYRWTRGTSTAHLPNPGGTAVVTLRLAGGAGRTVPVAVRTAGEPLRFAVGPEVRRYALLQPMPPGQRVPLTIAAPTIEERNRTLGIVVAGMGLSGGGSVPGYVLLALLLATAGGYALLRQAGNRPLVAVLLVLLAQVVVLLWLAAGGWRYALAVPLLLLVALACFVALALGQWLGRAPPKHATASRGALTAAHFRLVLLVLLAALALRLPWLGAPDPVGDLELAARRMGFLYREGLAGAYVYDGDYVPLRLYLLWALSQFVLPLGGDFYAPLPFVTKLLIKLPALLADLATISILYVWSLRWMPPRRAAVLAALYACAPPIWINVAWWGQVDALLMLPLLGMVVLLDRAGGRWSWLCWSVALLIKPQAIVLAPLLYIATVRRHGSRGIAWGGTLAVGLFVLACVPLVLAGQGPGLMQAYVGSVGRFPNLTAGAYNIWYLVTMGGGGHDTGQGIGGLSFRAIGFVLVGSVALLVGAVLLRRSDGPMRAEAAAVLALAFFALPTQIHERYLFLVLAFLALRIASSERLAIPFVLLVLSATINIMGDLDGFIPLATALIAATPLPFVLAVLNLAILAFLIGHMLASSQPAAAAPVREPQAKEFSTSRADNASASS